MRLHLAPWAFVRILVTLASAAGPFALAQTPPQNAQPLPIELYGNHIFVKVGVNGCQPMNFVLDTGTSAPFLNRRRASECDVDAGHSRTRRQVGTGEGAVELARAAKVSLKLDALDLSAKDTYVLPLDDLESGFGRPIDGILGPEIFEQHVVEIDYVLRTLRLLDAKSFAYTGPGQTIPIQILNHRPYLIARVQVAGHAPQEGLFVIDVGDGSALSLHSPFVAKYGLAPREQDAIATVTYGVAGASRQLIGRAQSLRIGTVLMQGPITAFSQAVKGSAADRSYDGAIGGEILRRFKLIFDYSRRQLIRSFWRRTRTSPIPSKPA